MPRLCVLWQVIVSGDLVGGQYILGTGTNVVNLRVTTREVLVIQVFIAWGSVTLEFSTEDTTVESSDDELSV